MKVLIALIVAACATGAAVLPHVGSRSAATAHRGRSVAGRVITRGTVIAVHPIATGAAYTVRTNSGDVVEFAVDRNRPVRTSDGLALAASSVRTGDTIVVRSGRQVVDASQRSVHWNVTIGEVSNPTGDSLVVQAGSSRGIVVDIARETHLVGNGGSVSSAAVFEDADQVAISGILDEALGEMTQTSAITWLGPRISPPGSHGST